MFPNAVLGQNGSGAKAIPYTQPGQYLSTTVLCNTSMDSIYQT